MEHAGITPACSRHPIGDRNLGLGAAAARLADSPSPRLPGSRPWGSGPAPGWWETPLHPVPRCCVFAPALGGLLLSGCAVRWNPVQREGLDADGRALLRGAG